MLHLPLKLEWQTIRWSDDVDSSSLWACNRSAWSSTWFFPRICSSNFSTNSEVIAVPPLLARWCLNYIGPGGIGSLYHSSWELLSSGFNLYHLIFWYLRQLFYSMLAIVILCVCTFEVLVRLFEAVNVRPLYLFSSPLTTRLDLSYTTERCCPVTKKCLVRITRVFQ